jgi:hypothetical protein
MNKAQLQNSVHFRVRLRPIARRFSAERELKAIDDDWIVSDVATYGPGVGIQNIRTNHVLRLGFDQIHHFSEDVARDRADGVRHGFFELRGQVRLSGPRAEVEPLPSYCPVCGAATRRTASSSRQGSAL